MSASDQPPPQAVATLPVFHTLALAFPLAYGNPGLLLRAAAGGMVMIAAAAAIFLAVPNLATMMLLIGLAPLAAYSHFGVNWYRIVLLGPAGLVRPALRWDRRHWQVFGYALAINLATLFVQVPLTLALPFLATLIALVVFYVTARLSFIFPALAVEERYSLALSWRHTQGQGLRLTAALLLAGLPLYFLLSIVLSQLFALLIGVPMATVAELGPEHPDAIAQIVAQVSPFAVVSVMVIAAVLLMAVLAVLFAIVAIAFRTCTGWVPAAPRAVVEVFGDDDPGSGH